MDYKLEQLLVHYMQERRNLTRELRAARQEHDYRLMARLQKSLVMVERQYYQLRALQDPQLDEREMLARTISRLQKLLQAKKTEERVVGPIVELLAHYEQQQAQLEQRPATLAAPPQILLPLMEQLLARQVRGFSLVISAAIKLQVHIRRVRQTAILTLPEVRRHRAEHTINKRQLRQLQRLGFTLYDQQDQLLAFEPLADTQDTARILQIWMKICCVVFDCRHFRHDAQIRYFT
jgi:hypothetical protein